MLLALSYSGLDGLISSYSGTDGRLGRFQQRDEERWIEKRRSIQTQGLPVSE